MAVMTLKEAAELLRVDQKTLLRWARGGKVPALVLPDRSVRLEADVLRRWMQGGRGERDDST